MALFNPATITVPSTIATIPAMTTVAAATASTAILAANANRKGSTIYNSSTARLYIAMGATASVASFTALLEAGGYYETPFGYTGAISGIWAAANGNALVTELT